MSQTMYEQPLIRGNEPPHEVSVMTNRQIRVLPAKFPTGFDLCDPHDTTWWWWWAPAIQPLPVVLLAFVYHLAAAGQPFEILRVAKALGVGPKLVVAALLVLETHGLLKFTRGPEVYVFSEIPRPSVQAAEIMREEPE